MQVKFNNSIISNIQFHSATFYNNKSKRAFVLALGWALKKGDLWYDDNPQDAKFFDIGKKVYDSGVEQYGVYIGRLALVFMRDEKINKIKNGENSYGL